MGGTISPRKDTTVAKDGNQSYTITASAGYVISRVKVVKGTASETIEDAAGKTSYAYTFKNVQTDGQIEASFEKSATTYTITASAGENGSINPSGSVSVTSGGSQTFTITASNDYEVADVLVDNVSQGAIETHTFTNVTANHTISVTFKRKPATTYTIEASAGENGTISPPGSVSVTSGGSQTFNISASEGYEVADVLVDSESKGTITTYTFTDVTANHTISVTFKRKSATTYTITASAGANGSISPPGSVSVTSGGSQTFTITAFENYNVAAVFVDGVAREVSATTYTYTFTNVTADHTITATFE
jgi:hypothetical protein